MRISRWVRTAANTRSEYVVLIDFPLQQWLYDRNSMLRYTYIACLLYFSYRSAAHVHLNVNVKQTAYIIVYTRCVICADKTSYACIQMFNFRQNHQFNHNATVSMAST